MNSGKEKFKGKLYIVSTPIGNKDDITIRAMNSLKRCDFVICEELKIGSITLRNLNLTKELVQLNEHNEQEVISELIDRLKTGEKACLISDAGTPLIADPGNKFVKRLLSEDIEIEVVPGVTSIITALVRSGFSTEEFVFAGFVGQKAEDRYADIRRLAKENRTVVILETPYRLMQILEALATIMPERKAYIGMNLTHPYETHHYGTFNELNEKFREHKLKSEFVICFEGSNFTGMMREERKKEGRETYDSPRRYDDNRPRERKDGYERKKSSGFSRRDDTRDGENRSRSSDKKGFAPKGKPYKKFDDSRSDRPRRSDDNRSERPKWSDDSRGERPRRTDDNRSERPRRTDDARSERPRRSEDTRGERPRRSDDSRGERPKRTDDFKKGKDFKGKGKPRTR